MKESFRNKKKHRGRRAWAAFGMGAAAIYGARVLINLFGPGLPYTMD